MSVIIPFHLAESAETITVEILDSEVSIPPYKIRTHILRKDSLSLLTEGFSSINNNDYEFSTVYTEILGRNFNDPNSVEGVQSTGTSFFTASTSSPLENVCYSDYWPLNFQYKNCNSSFLPKIYLVSNKHVITHEYYDPIEPLYQRTAYNFYVHLINTSSSSNESSTYNQNIIQDHFHASFKIAKVRVPIASLQDPFLFKSHPVIHVDVSALKIDQIFQSIYTELQTQSLTRYSPYYFAFNMVRDTAAQEDFITGSDLKMYGYPLGHHGCYAGIIRVGHLASSQFVRRYEGEILDFCTDMASSGGSSGSPLLITTNNNFFYAGANPPKIEKLAGILYAGPDNQADNIGYGIKFERIIDVCNF